MAKYGLFARFFKKSPRLVKTKPDSINNNLGADFQDKRGSRLKETKEREANTYEQERLLAQMKNALETKIGTDSQKTATQINNATEKFKATQPNIKEIRDTINTEHNPARERQIRSSNENKQKPSLSNIRERATERQRAERQVANTSMRQRLNRQRSEKNRDETNESKNAKTNGSDMTR